MSVASKCFSVCLMVAIASPVWAEDLTFSLVNETNLDLVRFYTSPSDADDWEEDVFGDSVLTGGSAVDITIADGREQCTYDMRFEMEDGQVLEDSTDLCELGSYTLTQ